MTEAVKTILKEIYGQGGAEWVIYAASEEKAKNACWELIERFRPKISPDDEFEDFHPLKERGAYSCRYSYRYAAIKRRVIR